MNTGPESVPDVSSAGKLLGASIPLSTISTCLFSLRVYTRSRPGQYFGWDDLAISLAMAAAMSQLGLLLSGIPFGLGRHNYYVSLDNQIAASRLLLLSQLPWGWGVALAKISIACLLLRIKNGIYWRVLLITMITIQIGSALCANAVQIFQCRPLSAVWDPSIHDAQCWPVSIAHTSIYANAAIALVTDIILAFVPITFIRNIGRPLREKVALGFLMGLGLLTAVAVVVKIPLVNKYGKLGDTLWDIVDLATWSVVEAHIGIIAACVPCLKSPFERAKKRMSTMSRASYRDSWTMG